MLEDRLFSLEVHPNLNFIEPNALLKSEMKCQLDKSDVE